MRPSLEIATTLSLLTSLTATGFNTFGTGRQRQYRFTVFIAADQVFKLTNKAIAFGIEANR